MGANGSQKQSQVDETATSGSASALFIDPMLLLRTDSLPDGEQWFYELKLDGYPAIALKRNGVVTLRSRNDNDFSGQYPGVVKGLAKMPTNTIIDGEIIAFDDGGRPSFNALQNYGSAPAVTWRSRWAVSQDGLAASWSIDLALALMTEHISTRRVPCRADPLDRDKRSLTEIQVYA